MAHKVASACREYMGKAEEENTPGTPQGSSAAQHWGWERLQAEMGPGVFRKQSTCKHRCSQNQVEQQGWHAGGAEFRL